MLTDTHLRLIMPRLAPAKRQLYLPLLNQAMQVYEITGALRAAAFLAQLAHESGEFRWMEEIWGPTDAQRRYEPPADLAKRLGNTQPGDGKRFKGRGPIQITGRDNYRRYGKLLGLDLEAQPDLAATPAVAFSVAGLFWRSNGLNVLADKDDFTGITRRINGGVNGLADRQAYYARARDVLGSGFTWSAAAPASAPTPAPVTRSRSAKTVVAAPAAAALVQPIKRPRAALPRGQELLSDEANAKPARTTASKTASKTAGKTASKTPSKTPSSTVRKTAARPATKTTRK